MEAFTLAICRAIRRATCVEECEQCVQECVRVLLNGTVYTQTRQRTFRYSVTLLHALNIEDDGDTQTLRPHMCPRAFAYRTHAARQIVRHIERFASSCESNITSIRQHFIIVVWNVEPENQNVSNTLFHTKIKKKHLKR